MYSKVNFLNCCIFATISYDKFSKIKKMLKNKIIYLILLTFLFSSCSTFSKKDQNKEEKEKVEKKRIEPNIFKKLEEEDSGILRDMGKKKTTTFEFSTSNPLWRASLSTIDFMPLSNVSYSGGTIITDWYSSDSSNESIKLNIQFLSNELKASSIKVVAHKKICESKDICKTIKIKGDFPEKIKENILAKAIDLNIKDQTIKK